MPEISVIVPVYKVEKYLKQCVDSILKQSFSDFEVILVDDGSPDNSGLLCDEYAGQDERVLVIHQENGGLSCARNSGLEVAKGEYIAFVDSDDFLPLDALEIMYESIKKEAADVVVGMLQLVDLEGDSLPAGEQLKTHEYKVFTPGKVSELLYKYLPLQVAWTKLYRKFIWKELRFPVGMIHEDEFVSHYVLEQAEKYVLLPNICYYYRINPQGIMHTHHGIHELDVLIAFYERHLFMSQNGYVKGARDSEVAFWRVFLREWPDCRAKDKSEKQQKGHALRLYRELYPFIRTNHGLHMIGDRIAMRWMYYAPYCAGILLRAKRNFTKLKKGYRYGEKTSD